MSFIREYILVTGDDYIMANYISTNFLMSSSEKHTCWTQISCQGMNVEVARRMFSHVIIKMVTYAKHM